MNFSKVAVRALTNEQRQIIVDNGSVSPVILTSSFQEIDEYPEESWEEAARDCTGPASFCESYKTNGEPNFNFIGYIPVSNAFLRASLYTIRYYPLQFLNSWKHSWNIYFSPAHRTVGVNEATFAGIKAWADFTDNVLCEKLTDRYYANKCTRLRFIYISTILVVSVLVLLNVNQIFENWERKVVFFLILTIVYTSFVGTLFEQGENNRFRLETDPLFLILLGVMLQKLTMISRRIVERFGLFHSGGILLKLKIKSIAE